MVLARRLLAVAAVGVATAQPLHAQAPLPTLSIQPPRQGLPSEKASEGKSRFSFIAYGDTRGSRDSRRRSTGRSFRPRVRRAPLCRSIGAPEGLAAYLRAGAPQHDRVDRIISASTDTLKDPHHYLVVHVDGRKIRVEAFGVAWGDWFMPYGQNGLVLADPKERQ